MRTNISRVIGGLALGMALLVGNTAWGGYQWTANVFVNSAGTYASGNLPDARYSGERQYIGCLMNEYSISCYARNEDGRSLSCVSYDPAHEAPVLFMTSTSHLRFYVNSSGFCTSVYVNNNSFYLE